MQQIKLYEDGNRLIVVFDNTTASVKSLIQSILQTAAPVSVPSLEPVKIPEEPMPNIAVMKPALPEIKENALLQEKGFAGFCEIYEYYKTYGKQLPIERSDKLRKLINEYAYYCKNRNPEQISDEELKSILKLGAEKVFASTMQSCLQQSGFLSLGDFLESGRTNLIDAYLACFRV